MADRTCRLCGKKFSKPYWLRKHLEGKRSCKPILDPEDLPPDSRADPDLKKRQCPYCNRVLKSYSSMRRHVREACKIPPTKRNGDGGMEMLFRRISAQQRGEIAQIRAQTAEILAKVEGLATQPARVTANTVVINVNVFGAESMKHIELATVHRILTGSANMPDAAGALGCAIYCDRAHPENLTCHMLNKREGQVMVRESDGWVVRPESSVFPRMHRAVTNIAFARQPRDADQALQAAPILRELARAEETGSYPVDVYSALLTDAKRVRGELKNPGTRPGREAGR